MTVVVASTPTLPATLVVRGPGTFDVTTYGARGDWTSGTSGTDNRAAIQAAIDAASAAGGGDVIIPGGKYYCTHGPNAMGSWAAFYSLLIPSNVRLRGVGGGTLVFPYHDSDAYAGIGFAPHTKHAGVYDLRMQTNIPDSNVGVFGKVGYPNRETVEFAINLENYDQHFITIQNCHFKRFPGHRVMAYATTSTDETQLLTDIIVKGCTEEQCCNVSVTCILCRRVLIEGNDFRDSATGECITFGQAQHMVVSDNILGSTLHSEEIEDFTVTGNTIFFDQTIPNAGVLMRCGGAGVGLISKRISVVGNTFDCTNVSNCSGIYVFTGEDYVISGNTIRKSAGTAPAISCQASAIDGLVVVDNVIADEYGNTGDDISLQGTNVVVRGNVCKNSTAGNSISAVLAPAVSIQGNVCASTIRIETIDDAAISDNKTASRITVTGGCNRTLIRGNRTPQISLGSICYLAGNILNGSTQAYLTAVGSAGSRFDRNYVLQGATNYRTGDVVDGVTQ